MGEGGGVTLQLFGHPFSSCTQKVLIALWADGTEFEYRRVPDDEENYAELKRHSPFGLFPVLLDDGQPVLETTCIIEHLQARHSGPNRWIPDGELGRRARFLDRFFDLYVMTNMQKAGNDVLRPEESRDPYGVAKARAGLETAYDWLEANLGDGPWAAGEQFTLADCAAAPSLFYADWVEAIPQDCPRLAALRAELLALPEVVRCVDDARPYRPYFPYGAPDRD
jgi:glutathione S-transferase